MGEREDGLEGGVSVAGDQAACVFEGLEMGDRAFGDGFSGEEEGNARRVGGDGFGADFTDGAL